MLSCLICGVNWRQRNGPGSQGEEERGRRHKVYTNAEQLHLPGFNTYTTRCGHSCLLCTYNVCTCNHYVLTLPHNVIIGIVHLYVHDSTYIRKCSILHVIDHSWWSDVVPALLQGLSTGRGELHISIGMPSIKLTPWKKAYRIGRFVSSSTP